MVLRAGKVQWMVRVEGRSCGDALHWSGEDAAIKGTGRRGAVSRRRKGRRGRSD